MFFDDKIVFGSLRANDDKIGSHKYAFKITSKNPSKEKAMGIFSQEIFLNL